MSAILPILTDIAKTDPNRLAIVWNNQELSYAGLVARVAATRKRLEPLGLQPGHVAAVMISHLVQGWIALLALQSLGVITIAVRSVEELGTIDLPELAYLVTHSSEQVPALAASRKAAGLKRIVLEPLSSPELTADLGQVDLPAAGGHILSTSGTTGSYKRVLIDAKLQRARTDAMLTVVESLPATLSYHGSLGLWTAGGYDGPIRIWRSMGTVVLDQRPQRHLAFRERKLQRATLTLPELEAVLNASEGELPYSPELQLFVAGSAIPWRLAEKAMKRLTPLVFSPLGSTEVGALCITLVRSPDDLLSHTIHPSRTVEVVDEAGQLVPNGTIGRLRVRLQPGDITSYLNDEVATRTFFGDGCFYPGDLASIEPDGRLKLQGRANDVITLGGNKVATLPVEQEIQARMGAKGACIISQPEGDGEDSLHIFLELDRPLTEADRALLATVARGWKPEIHVIDALPRNDMGKVNRIELRRRLREERQPAQQAAG
jgi:acyl-coenzyme A synthetase/AMP-(fatty) acid ligase